MIHDVARRAAGWIAVCDELSGHCMLVVLSLSEDREAAHVHHGTGLASADGMFKTGLEHTAPNLNGQVVSVHRNTSQRGMTLRAMRCITFDVVDGKIVSGEKHFLDLLK